MQLNQAFGLPVDDDYLYEAFGITKPVNYNQIKAEAAKEAEAARAARMLGIAAQIQAGDDDDDPDDGGDDEPHDDGAPKKQPKKTLKNALRSFFGLAPDAGADDW